MSKRFTLSEREKTRISDLHIQKIIDQRNIMNEQQNPTPSAPRYKNAVCPAGKVRCDQTVLRIQIRMNDECDDLGTKLIEDGILGPKTKSAWASCKTKLTPTKKVSGGGGETQVKTDDIAKNLGVDTKTDGIITANDIATLTS